MKKFMVLVIAIVFLATFTLVGYASSQEAPKVPSKEEAKPPEAPPKEQAPEKYKEAPGEKKMLPEMPPSKKPPGEPEMAPEIPPS